MPALPPASTTSLAKPSTADRSGRRRRIKLLLWRTALGAASATGAGLVTLVIDRITALF
ncbi:hypothetical protein [Streptomyces malaysiensis]|uniref:hypothetical protein n=1 Tax=Streptomyces malaysiensis TaxID=92644 RepID=UPI00142E91F5|nr:hypothetical protein [Streptomyces malaysiensis]